MRLHHKYMCGIVGIAGMLPKKFRVEKARETLVHRGPDDRGLYYCPEENIALGHRRLSIIDLSQAGSQPLLSSDGRFVVVFNGEIYNYIEIRKEIGQRYSFKTKTDTEVLLASYIVWGEKCLEKLNGMFAFAIWDKREKKLFCARDRLGIKPFFYSMHGDTLFFASEIKALLSLGIPHKPNEQIIFEYLYHGLYDHRSETFFEGIKRLDAGHALIWKNGNAKKKKYWSLADRKDRKSDGGSLSEGEVEDRFVELLSDSIKLQLRSDVSVGVNLSSGADSNLLFRFAQRETDQNPNLFSMCSTEERFNECFLIKNLLSSAEKKKWNTNCMDSRGIWSGAERMNEIQDQPFGGIPTILYDGLNQEAKKSGTTVLLEGQGLDELLAGYKYYLLDYARDTIGGGKKENIDSSVVYSQDMSSLTAKETLQKNFVSRWKQKKLLFASPFKSHLLNAQYRDIVHTKLPRVLRFNDHASMAHGRELRVPFLDHRIVEFCFYLPVQYKINNGVQKFLVRKILKKQFKNASFMKPKKAFGAVQTELFRRYCKKEIAALLESRSFKKRGYWDNEMLQKKVQDMYDGKQENSFFLWQCINLELWFREFID